MARLKKWWWVGGLVLVAGAIVTLVLLLTMRPAVAQTAKVSFTSVEPTEGVEILVGAEGQPLGNTPFSVQFPPGRYVYVATVDGYRPVTGEFAVEPGAGNVQVVVPTLAPLGGEIQVRCNAPAQLYVAGQAVGTCSTSGYASLGRYAVGQYQVQAVTALETQEQTVTVYDMVDGQVEFAFGGRLVVVVESVSVTLGISVDGRPYTAPVSYTPAQLAKRPFAQVEVVLPDYLPWQEDVFLQAGETVTVTAVLTADTRPDDIEAAYWQFWQVWNEAGQTLEADLLPTVMTGTMLVKQTEGFAALAGMLTSWGIEPAPHTPTFTLVTDVTATARVNVVVTQTTVPVNGTATTAAATWDGVFTLARGGDGMWRVAQWENLAVVVVPPTVTPGSGGGGGGGGGGSGRPEAADRSVVAQIILASINCQRVNAGQGTLAWDPEIAATLQSYADQATIAYRDTFSYPPELTDAVRDALQVLGAGVIEWSGLPLSFVQGNADIGEFAFDWMNYVDRPCETGYGQYRSWAGAYTRIGVAIGAPYWAGDHWQATVIIGAR